MATVTIATVKARLKTIITAASGFGSVYAEERYHVDDPLDPYVQMWTDGGTQKFEAGDDLMREPRIIIRVYVPMEPGPGGEVEMQTTLDARAEAVLDALRVKPKLNTASGDGPLVIQSIVESWTQRWDGELKRGVIELTFRAMWIES